MKLHHLVVLFLSALSPIYAQDMQAPVFEQDSMVASEEHDFYLNNQIMNPSGLLKFFKKAQSDFYKLNVAHVGDSHLQADLFSGVVRKKMQKQFGNGGRGLVFPYKLAKTNGASDVKFSSNIVWQSFRNVGPVTEPNVGLSGFLLQTQDKNLAIEIEVRDPENYFSVLKVVSPQNSNMFDIAFAKTSIKNEKIVPKSITHKIKNGEAISIIADKYNVSVAAIKKLNGLKTNQIRAGKTLKIPGKVNESRTVETFSFQGIPFTPNIHFNEYIAAPLNQKAFLVANKSSDEFLINAIILENNKPGLLYHSIGVNGARFSDYNKYPIFFEQLNAIHPDLVIVSFGTNESYDKLDPTEFMNQLETFIHQVRDQAPDASILVTTPPPSMYKRNTINNYVQLYAKAIVEQAENLNYSVFDLYAQLGGNDEINKKLKGFIASDKVHYTKSGYELQGELLSAALLESFTKFKESNK